MVSGKCTGTYFTTQCVVVDAATGKCTTPVPGIAMDNVGTSTIYKDIWNIHTKTGCKEDFTWWCGNKSLKYNRALAVPDWEVETCS